MPDYPYRIPAGGGPPGPIMDATFFGRSRRQTVAAFIDTGADMTQIPEDLAHYLELRRIGEVTFRGPGDEEIPANLYVADNLELGGFGFPYVELVAPDADSVLIGRDLLASLISTFNGPTQRFSLEGPGTEREPRRP